MEKKLSIEEVPNHGMCRKAISNTRPLFLMLKSNILQGLVGPIGGPNGCEYTGNEENRAHVEF